MSLKRAFWSWAHNVFAHGLEGWLALLTLGRPAPRWLDAFHDWTAQRAWGESGPHARPLGVPVAADGHETLSEPFSLSIPEGATGAIHWTRLPDRAPCTLLFSRGVLMAYQEEK